MKRITAPVSVFAILLAMYLWTLVPGNFWIDSAAFSTCNVILGLPHSPSFPLYTVLGRVFGLLFTDPAAASNVYSAAASAATGVVLFYLIRLFLARLGALKNHRTIVAICGALFAGFSLPLWQSSVRAEVYALQTLLAFLTIYLIVHAMTNEDGGSRLRPALLAVFMQGLSFANHSLLALITVPLFAVLIWKTYREVPGILFWKVIGWSAVLFAIAISFYLYLPVRANQDPAINSGRPTTIAATINAITRSGEDYIPASSIPEPKYFSRAGRLSVFIFEQTGGLILLGLTLAIIAAFDKKRRLLWMLFAPAIVGFAITIWAADFQMFNFDIVAYSGISLALIIAAAFIGLYLTIEKYYDRIPIRQIVPFVFVLMAFFELYGNLYAADLSATRGPDIAAEAILQFAPDRALLLVNEDDIVLPLWYHCFALHKRPDVAIISAGALYRPDYREQVKHLYPDIVFPAAFKQRKITDMKLALAELCQLNKSHRPIQIQFGVPGIDAKNLYPDGLLFRYTEQDISGAQSAESIAKILELVTGNATDLLTIEFVARNAFNYGAYFDRIGQSDEARLFFQYAIEIDADNPEYLLRLGIAMLNAGRQADAMLLLEQAVKTGDGCPEAEKLLARIQARRLS